MEKALEKNSELERKALLIYSYIKDGTISYGKAAEILGIHKSELIEIYGRLGISYFDLDIEEVEEEVLIYKKLKEKSEEFV